MRREFKIKGHTVTVERDLDSVRLSADGIVLRERVEDDPATAQTCEQWVFITLIEMEQLSK